MFFLVISLISCKKYGDGYVKGTVVEKGTNIPIAGADMYLKYWSNSKPGNTFIQTYTDANGNYIIPFDKKMGNSYEIHCQDTNYWYKDQSQHINEKKSICNFSVTPYAYLKLHVIKTTSYQWVGVSIGGDLSYSIFNNNPFDTIFPTVFRVKGNRSNDVNWTLHYPVYNATYDTSKQFYGNIYINKNDTAIYTIQYN